MSGSSSSPTPVQAESTFAFINSIGIDAHIGALDTAYGYNASKILPSLQYLGLKQIGDSTPLFASTLSEYESLAALGYQFSLGANDPNTPISSYIAAWNAMEQTVPGSIVGITTINEAPPSTFGSAQAWQQTVYTAVHSDSQLNGVPVDAFTFGTQYAPTYNNFGTIQYADQGNAHVYSAQSQPIYYLWYANPLQTQLEPGEPWIVGETGYSTADTILNGQDIGSDQKTAAILQLNDIFDMLKAGASKIYMYQLFDEANDPNYTTGYENHLGFFTADGTPTLKATAIHDLTTILADSGSSAASFNPGTLSYSITGLNPNAPSATTLEADFGYGILNGVISQSPVYSNSLLLEKSNGSFDLVLWAEPQIWNSTTLTEMGTPTENVVVQLAQAVASVEIYDPILGTSVIASATNTSTVTVQLNADPLIIELDPYATSAPATTAPAPSASTSSGTTTFSPTGVAYVPTGTVVVGSGNDTIALTVAEDYYAGNAQFYVLVDGNQVGGLQTASAQIGLGQTQTFDIEGNFGGGAHQIAVVFTNDLYGGYAAADRNLYVLGASYDGLQAPSSQLTLLANGLQTINVGIGVPGPTTVGSGSDTIALNVSEDEYLGNAQFTVSVDGQQIGGVLTASAVRSAGEQQIFNIMGNFGDGQHSVAINLLNGTSVPGYELADRALYVNGATIDGSAIADGTLGQDTTGAEGFIATKVTAGVIPPAVIYLGSGPDSVAFFVSGDYYQGNAAFTLSVDGHQVGGTQYTTAVHAAGQSQEFDVQGNFGPGAHSASITFLNDAAATPYNAALDRNVYLNVATINGNTIANSSDALLTNSTATFGFITPGTPATTAIGQGPDTLALTISEDYYQANAEFTVAVDGTQIGGLQTATAIRGNGQSQVLNVLGSFSGTHTVALTFVNDASSTPYQATLDRNLYVGGASIDGSGIANSNLSLLAGGTQTFTFNH